MFDEITFPQITGTTESLGVFTNAKFHKPNWEDVIQLKLLGTSTPEAFRVFPFSFLEWGKFSKIANLPTPKMVLFSTWNVGKHFVSVIFPTLTRCFSDFLSSFFGMFVSFSIFIANGFSSSTARDKLFCFFRMVASGKSKFRPRPHHGFSKTSFTAMFGRTIGDLCRRAIKSLVTLNAIKFFAFSVNEFRVRHINLHMVSSENRMNSEKDSNPLYSYTGLESTLSQAFEASKEGATTSGCGTILPRNTRTSVRPERDDIVCSAW